jgi:hypothetical protein
VEFNCNDGIALEYCSELPCKLEYGGINHTLRRGYERLLRKLLMLPHRPAVIMLQTFDFSERCSPGRCCQLPCLICCRDMRLLLLLLLLLLLMCVSVHTRAHVEAQCPCRLVADARLPEARPPGFPQNPELWVQGVHEQRGGPAGAVCPDV